MPGERLVSIITPSFNQAQFLRATIRSVLEQDYANIEYLILDGGSTDDSVEIIRSFQDRIAYWISRPDKGQVDAINRGWQHSRGDILSWLNSDDIYESGAISAVADIFRRFPEVDVVTANCHVIDATGNVLYKLPSGEFNIRAMLSGNSLPQPGVFCRRTAVEAAGWLDTRLRYVFDWALWLKLWLNGAKFYYLPRTVANFRIWEESKTGSGTIGASLSGGIRFARERLMVLTELLESPQVQKHPETFTLLQEAYAGNLLEMALLHHLDGDHAQTQDYLQQYVTAQPCTEMSNLHAQALAAHLAYLDMNIEQATDRFVNVVANTRTMRGCTLHLRQWKRVIRSETELVQAWHAAQLSDNRCSANHFMRALAANPKLLLQRRVFSPTVKQVFKAFFRPGRPRSSLKSVRQPAQTE